VFFASFCFFCLPFCHPIGGRDSLKKRKIHQETSGSAKRMRLCSAEFRLKSAFDCKFGGKFAAKHVFKSEVGTAQQHSFCKSLMMTPKQCTDLDWTHLYCFILTYTTFVWKNKMPAPGVCLLQTCSSAGRRFAASKSRLHYYQRILWSPQ